MTLAFKWAFGPKVSPTFPSLGLATPLPSDAGGLNAR